MDSKNQHQPFVSLPVELLEEIYILSETLALSHVCRRFYISLSSQSARLRFCTRLFYVDNPRKDPDKTDVYLHGKQTEILAQEWFNLGFVLSLEAAVEHIRATDIDMTGNMVRSELSPNTYLDTETNAQIYYPFFVSGVHLPTRLLCGPWSQSKIGLLLYLGCLELKTNPLDKLKYHEGMKVAIAEANWVMLVSLAMIGPGPDLDVFKDLVLSGRSSIVQQLFDWVRKCASLFWDDSEILEWVKDHGKEELERRGTTEKAEASL